jgi:hypothetical protein
VTDAGVPGRALLRRPASVRWWWSGVDRHTTLTRLAVAGLVLTGVLAVFGLPPVDLHSPMHHLGVMDPLCGMTRGVRLAVRGDLAAAMRYNPAAPLVPLGGVLLVARHAYGRRTGRWADLSVRWAPILVAVATLAVALLWARQQANADLLTYR